MSVNAHELATSLVLIENEVLLSKQVCYRLYEINVLTFIVKQTIRHWSEATLNIEPMNVPISLNIKPGGMLRSGELINLCNETCDVPVDTTERYM